jgi:group I intron endonuclease
MTVAIYRITNTANGKVYVGKTLNLARRWAQHRAALASGEHVGRSSRAMCQDAAIFGHHVFVFEVLEEFDATNIETLAAREMHYLFENKAFDPLHGYNQTTFSPNSKRVVEQFVKRDRERAHRATHGIGRHTILQIDLNGSLIRAWPSIKYLQKKFPTRVTRQGIQQASSGKNLTYKGFRWKMVPCEK